MMRCVMAKRRIWLNIGGSHLIMCLVLPAAVNAQTSTPADIEGRWFLTAELPSGKFVLPIEVIRQGKDQISAIALRGGVEFSVAALRGQRITLKGTSSMYGPVVITTRIDGAGMKGVGARVLTRASSLENENAPTRPLLLGWGYSKK
jgi:hypothetical protein